MTEIEEKRKKAKLKWSMKNCYWAALSILVVSSIAVFFISDRPVWVQLELTALIIGILMAAFFTLVLYHGVHFLEDERITLWISPDVSFDAGVDYTPGSIAAGADDPLGCLIALFLEVLFFLFFSFILAIILWIGVNVLIISILTISIPLFYVFQRSLRYVVRHAEECHNNLLRSLQYGLFYAVVKTALVCGFIFGAHKLIEHVLGS